MSKQQKNPAKCVNCGQATIRVELRDELFGRGAEAVIIESIPTQRCTNCGITYLTPEVSRLIDEICAHPERYVKHEPRAIAKIA